MSDWSRLNYDLVLKWRENNSNDNTNKWEIAPEMNASNIRVLVDLVKKGFLRKWLGTEVWRMSWLQEIIKKQRLKSTWRLHKKMNLRADSLKRVCMSLKRSQLAQVCVVFSLRTLDVTWFIFKGDGAMRTTLCLDGIHSFVCLVSCLYKDASVAFLGLLQGGPWGWEIHLHNIHSSNICEQMIAIK